MKTRRSARLETAPDPGPSVAREARKPREKSLEKTKTRRSAKQSTTVQDNRGAINNKTRPNKSRHPVATQPAVKRANKEHDNTNKRVKREPINFANLTRSDPVFEHLRESLRKYGREQETNLKDVILDQVALDGLAGITLNRLFLALEAVIPNFECLTNESSQTDVWAILVDQYLRYPVDTGIHAYYVDPQKRRQPRPAGANVSMKSIMIDKPLRLPCQTIQRFPNMEPLLHPVQEGFIMGSCGDYLSRVDITHELIHMFEQEGSASSLLKVNDQFGITNVFFVAGQSVRSRVLIPEWIDPNIDIKLREYCALEMIGKARTLGTVFPKDKALGRYRIMLEAKGLIIQCQPSYSSPIEHHLRRFSHLLPTKSVIPTKEFLLKDENCDDLEGQSFRDLSKLCCNPAKLKVDRSVLTMVYDIIARSSKGLTQYGIRRRLNMPKFHVRNHLKNLLSIKMICSRVTPNSDGQSRLYKTAHKSRRHKKLKGELAKPTGIMASWDETDLRAKKIIGHKRSSFSQAEDSLLILCRITSILIEPNLRLSWCVHKRLVRDLLHQELIESHDKTSDACLRRIKYLKRLPNNIMSINELTAELQDDKDISRLVNSRANDKPTAPLTTDQTDVKLDKLFVQVLKLVRSKIPNLLGITGCTSLDGGGARLAIEGPAGSSRIRRGGQKSEQPSREVKLQPISSYEELDSKYQLVECQSVASIKRAPTYEAAKNLVDAKFNIVCLVTMAFTLTSCFDSLEQSKSATSKRACQWLLDKFYSSHPDKLISSALSKLNKRSLLTRKCPVEQASLFKPRTKISLKLNQSVLFLLNRYHANSLIQLVRPISQLYKVNLNESNEMAAIGLLTSLCSMNWFNLSLKLKIPLNVVAIDQGSESFRNLCDKADEKTRNIFARFMSRCGGSLEAPHRSELDQEHPTTTTTTTREEKTTTATTCNNNNKMDDSRRALFLLRHELKANALDKCGSLSDCLIVQPCNVNFYSNEPELELDAGPFELFLNRMAGQVGSGGRQSDWLVKSFQLDLDGVELNGEETANFDKFKRPHEFEARLWKRIDGSVHKATLFKLLESLLSWVIVFPGIEFDLLERELNHLIPREHLLELLELMESLSLISSNKLANTQTRLPRLFGYKQIPRGRAATTITTYEATAGAYVKYCQLLNLIC